MMLNDHQTSKTHKITYTKETEHPKYTGLIKTTSPRITIKALTTAPEPPKNPATTNITDYDCYDNLGKLAACNKPD